MLYTNITHQSKVGMQKCTAMEVSNLFQSFFGIHTFSDFFNFIPYSFAFFLHSEIVYIFVLPASRFTACWFHTLAIAVWACWWPVIFAHIRKWQATHYEALTVVCKEKKHATQSTLNGKAMHFVFVASVLNYTLLGVINNMHSNELCILKVW